MHICFLPSLHVLEADGETIVDGYSWTNHSRCMSNSWMCILWKNRIHWLMETGVEAGMNLQLLESVGKPDQRRV